ncbi:MAG TPA: M48 family metalloprotease [Alphaproteobacteria bacterium]|nr:M48 family metalloprotease [Alphaproteobacteria bacterium]HOO49838.1 M48 family metalloprotease [Alphaproteobacteria bacterium]
MSTYKFKDWAVFGVKSLATAAIVSISLTIASPWMLIPAGIITAADLIAKLRKKSLSKSMLSEHEKVYTYSPKLDEIFKELAEKTGYKVEEVGLSDFCIDREKYKKSNRKRIFEETQQELSKLQHSFNAGANSLGSPSVMITKNLLRVLNDEEEKAVLAHEFAHIKANDSKVAMLHHVPEIFSATANIMTTCLSLTTIGITGALSAYLGGSLFSKIITKIQDKEGLLKNDYPLPSMEAAQQKYDLEKNSKALTWASILAGLAVQNHLAAILIATTASLEGLAILTTAIFNRSKEYRADRVAIELGANPLALMTALKKMDLYAGQNQIKPTEKREFSLTGMWRKLTSSHPTTEKRIKRLADIAMERGFNKNIVAKVVDFTPTKPSSNDMPLDGFIRTAISL